MKMIKNIKYWLTTIALIGLVTTSCIEEGEDDIAGKGTNEFRFSGDDFAVVTFLPYQADQQSAVITIYRDGVSKAAMDKEVTLTFEINSDSLAAYNTANGEDFIETDPSWYDLNIESGTITFAPNEGAKTIHITIDTNPFDLSESYAIPLVIKDASSGYSVNEAHNVIIIQTLPINKYDGVYTVKGSMVDASNGAFTHINDYRLTDDSFDAEHKDQQYALVTTGAMQCAVWDNDFFGGYYSPFTNGGTDYSRYGSWTAVFDFDGDDKIVKVTNLFGQPASNGRYGSVDPTATNQWSSDGIEGVGYRMHHPAVMGGAFDASTPDAVCTECYGSTPRTVWAENWTYLEPR